MTLLRTSFDHKEEFSLKYRDTEDRKMPREPKTPDGRFIEITTNGRKILPPREKYVGDGKHVIKIFQWRYTRWL